MVKTWKVAVRHDGIPIVLTSSKRVSRKEYAFVTTGFKTEAKATAYAVNLGLDPVKK